MAIPFSLPIFRCYSVKFFIFYRVKLFVESKMKESSSHFMPCTSSICYLLIIVHAFVEMFFLIRLNPFRSVICMSPCNICYNALNLSEDTSFFYLFVVSQFGIEFNTLMVVVKYFNIYLIYTSRSKSRFYFFYLLYANFHLKYNLAILRCKL